MKANDRLLNTWPVIRSLAKTLWTLGPHSWGEWAPSCVSRNLWPAWPGCTGTVWEGKSLGKEPSRWPWRHFEWNSSLEFQLPGRGYCDSLSISGRGREGGREEGRPKTEQTKTQSHVSRPLSRENCTATSQRPKVWSVEQSDPNADLALACTILKTEYLGQVDATTWWQVS